jgi:para-aminobenzoate synthetase component 1
MNFELLNTLGKNREPFLFISDFKAQKLEVILLKDLANSDVEFCINENYNYEEHPHSLDAQAIDFESYKQKFNKVIKKIEAGETYILNLTQATNVQTTKTLLDIYRLANAHYKLRFKDKFVCFSPETFIQIKDNSVHTFPMKGTINASIKNASTKILEDEKEMAEHVMIVDLLRNDLSIVSSNVKVEKFRYITKIDAGEKQLLQVSSHISGDLQADWQENIGTILKALLPAGSISGTPKKSTLEIIQNIEDYERGYFSGVFGVYDGKRLDSGVMIRFIEKTNEGLIYKSGGGITIDSDVCLEYNELQDKIYLP